MMSKFVRMFVRLDLKYEAVLKFMAYTYWLKESKFILYV